jgi:ferritin-like metal-binding protein YciE
MLARTLERQLVRYLTDAHALEHHALMAHTRCTPALADDLGLARIFKDHREESEEHEQALIERLRALDAEPPASGDAAPADGACGVTLFAQAQLDTPGRLAGHAYAYEQLELASYELLARMAERAGDLRVLSVALRSRDEEQVIAERLSNLLDAAAAALPEHTAQDLRDRLPAQLADAHALELQSLGLLEGTRGVPLPDELRAACEEHLEQTEAHARRVRECLEAHDAGAGVLEDAARRLGRPNWSLFHTQPDTPDRLAALLFAVEHLEIACYEQLARLAEAGVDAGTASTAREILHEERRAAARLQASFDAAFEASLEARPTPGDLADAVR